MKQLQTEMKSAPHRILWVTLKMRIGFTSSLVRLRELSFSLSLWLQFFSLSEEESSQIDSESVPFLTSFGSETPSIGKKQWNIPFKELKNKLEMILYSDLHPKATESGAGSLTITEMNLWLSEQNYPIDEEVEM